MTISARIIALFMLLFGLAGISACETIQGAGKDIQSGGEALEEAVQ
jgi:predicted small secreted protein